jgi:hypothetical protein
MSAAPGGHGGSMVGNALVRRAEVKIGFARRSSALLAAIFLVLPVCAACSSPTKQAFGPGYRAAIHQYRTEFDALKTQAQAAIGTDRDSQLRVFARMTDVTDATLKTLHQLSPPARVKPSFNRLIDTMSSEAADLRQIQRSARDGDQAMLEASLRAYASALETGTSLQHEVDVALARSTHT